jgi:hypothetical protein
MEGGADRVVRERQARSRVGTCAWLPPGFRFTAGHADLMEGAAQPRIGRDRDFQGHAGRAVRPDDRDGRERSGDRQLSSVGVPGPGPEVA